MLSKAIRRAQSTYNVFTSDIMTISIRVINKKAFCQICNFILFLHDYGPLRVIQIL